MTDRIAVRFTDGCSQLMREFGISASDVERTVNERSVAILTRELARLLIVRWIDDDDGIFVDSNITKKEREGSYTIFREVEVQLAIRVKADLPGGRLRDVDSVKWFRIVARSFGLPIKRESEPDSPPDFVYSGPRTKEFYVAPERAGGVLRIATLFPAIGEWDFMWFFDLPRYRDWYRTAFNTGRMVKLPPDDAWLLKLKEHVRSLPTKYPGLVAPAGGYQRLLAHSIIRMTLGDEWWRKNVHEQKVGPLAQADQRAQLRVHQLAEMFLNLRYIEGMAGRLIQLRAGNLMSVIQELETAQMIIRSGMPFRFVEPTGVKRKDFEARVRLPSGQEACCEVKGKDEDTALSDNTIVQTLKQAVKQVPANMPALFVVWLPDKWITDPKLGGVLEKATRRFFGKSGRAIAVEFAWASWRELKDKDGTPGLMRWTKFREYANERSPHYDERNRNCLTIAPMLDSIFPWTTLDAFLVSLRTAEEPPKVNTSRIYLT